MIQKKIFKVVRGMLTGLATVFIAGGLIFAPSDAFARYHHKPKVHKSDNASLTKLQQKRLVGKVVEEAMRHPFFVNAELPHEVSLALFTAIGQVRIDIKEFTNLILNRLLAYPKVMVVNQEVRTDLSWDLSLMRYEPLAKARETGLLLGADYIIFGSLMQKTVVNKKGKAEDVYLVDLNVQDIKSHKSILKQTVAVKK